MNEAMSIPAMGHATCGGHVTLLFTVEDSEMEPYLQGSRGAGLCLDTGCKVSVRGVVGQWGVNVNFRGFEGSEDIVKGIFDVVSQDLPRIRKMKWDVVVTNHLPTSQGFGMSAALAIAASRAIQRAIGEEYELSLRRSLLHAHIAERLSSSGLGDVTGISAGGVEIRTSPGAPFHGDGLQKGPGVALGWFQDMEMTLVWPKEKGHHTSEYIDDLGWKMSISDSGRASMLSLVDIWGPSCWPILLSSARSFVEQSGLLSDGGRGGLLEAVNSVIARTDEQAVASLCLLGNSIVITRNDLMSTVNLGIIEAALSETGLLFRRVKLANLSRV